MTRKINSTLNHFLQAEKVHIQVFRVFHEGYKSAEKTLRKIGKADPAAEISEIFIKKTCSKKCGIYSVLGAY